MNADIYGFSHEELCVMLDALYYYCENKRQRDAQLLKTIEMCMKLEDTYVIRAQLDTRAIDLRDKQIEMSSMLRRKIERFESFNTTAQELYEELLSHMENIEEV